MIIKKKSKKYILIVEGMQVKKKTLSMLQNYYRNTLDLKTGY